MPLDSLGDLVLTVGADLSSLEDTLQSVPAVAQQAGAAIDAALGSSLDGATASLQNLSDAVSGTGSASAASAPHIEDLGQAIKHSEEESISAATAMTELYEKVIQLAEAWAVFETVKEALDVSGQVEKFTVSMTLLTGSTEKAASVLEDVEQIAATQPFAFPELLPTVQHMQALGIAGEQLKSAMQAAGNAAAATGTSFESVAGALTRIEATGMVQARSIMALGLSWDDLAKHMSVSVAEVQQLFKKGGQDAATDLQEVIDTINSKFAGAAVALGKTLLGQWQIFQNQFHLVMEDLGNSLAPVAEALMGFAKSEILPALTALINGFQSLLNWAGQLREAFLPVQTGLGAVTASAKDLYAAFAADSLITSTVSASLQGFGQTLAEVITGAAEVAHGVLAVAAAFKEVETAMDMAALNTVVGMFKDLTGAVGLNTEAAKANLPPWASLHNSLTMLSNPVAGLLQLLGQLSSKLTDLSEKIPPAALGATDASTKFASVTAALASSMVAATLAANAHTIAIGKIGAEYDAQKQALTDAQQHLAMVKEAYDNGNASAGQLAEAQKGVAAATEALTGKIKQHKDAVNELAPTLAELAKQYDQNQLAVQAAKLVLDQARASYDQLSSAVDNSVVVLRGFTTAHSQSTAQVVAARGALDSATSSLNTMTAAHGNVAKALALVQQAQENYTAALRAADAMAKGHGESLDTLKAKYDANKLAVEQATSTLNEAIAANDGSAKMAEVVAMAQVNLTDAIKKLDEQTKAVTVSHQGHTAALHQLSTQAQETVGHFGDYSVVLGAATGATRVHVQSIQELTNHETALQSALVLARATLDAARNSFDGSSASVAILNAAQAQFNKLSAEADPLMRQQISDLNGLAGAAKSAGAAIKDASSMLDGFQSTVDRSSASVGMDQLMAMFAPFQSPLGLPSGVMSMGPIGSGAGMNQTIVDGEIISEADITPGTLSPTPKKGASSAPQSIAEALGASLSTVADAAAVLQKIAENDFAGAIAQLQKDGVSMQDAFNDVMGAADAMQQSGVTLHDLSTTAIGQIAGSVATMTGTFSGVAQAALDTITSTQSAVAAATVGVMAAVMTIVPAAAIVAAPRMSVGSLNQYGINTGLPSGAAGPYVGNGPPSITLQFNGPVVGGAAGMRELGNTLTDQMRRAGMKF